MILAPISAGAAGSEAGAGSPDLTEAARSAAAIYSDLMSPYCPGLLLSDCRSPAAADLRAEVRRELEAGVSEAEVRRRIEQRFGEKILAAPKARGFGLLAWLTPYVALVVAAALVLWWIRSQSASNSPPA